MSIVPSNNKIYSQVNLITNCKKCSYILSVESNIVKDFVNCKKNLFSIVLFLGFRRTSFSSDHRTYISFRFSKLFLLLINSSRIALLAPRPLFRVFLQQIVNIEFI